MTDKTIQTGKKLQLNFDVENRGTRRGSQTVELLLDDEVVDEAAAVLDSTEVGQLVLETDAFSDDDEGEVFVVETVIGTRTEATFEVEVVAIPDSEVLDDWADGQLTSNRDDFETTPYQFESDDEDRFNPSGTRPEWIEESGSPSVSDSKLNIGDGDTAELTDGADWEKNQRWESRLQVDSGVALQVRFRRVDGDNLWQISLFTDEITLAKRDEGSTTTLLSENISTGTEYEIWVERRTENVDTPEWEMWVDGTSVGTETDDFDPGGNDVYIQSSGGGTGHCTSFVRFVPK